MKRLLSVMLIMTCLFGLCACVPAAREGKTVVCTVFAAYDLVRVLTEGVEGVETVYLLKNGADIHSFKNSFTARDKRDILRCDVFVCVGGASEEWILDALDDPDSNPLRETVSMFDTAGDLLTEEETEGMKEERGEEEDEYDEHIWLSVRRFIRFCDAVSDALCRLVPDRADTITQNAAAYRAALEDLDAAYEEAAQSAEKQALIFADRYPFRYLFDDYSIRCFAAFPGCSTETATTYDNLVTLASLMNEYDADVLMLTEHSSVKIAPTLTDLSGRKNVKTATLDSLQSVTASEAETKTYLRVMTENLDVIKGALH